MFLVSTRNFPPELGGMQNLMEGLSNALLNHGPVTVFAETHDGDKDYDQRSKLNIQRFKGLGEMNAEELWNTTLDPKTRNLLQVQYSKDMKKDQSLIHTLMGNDVTLRKDFIISNAINVQNLDI